MSAFRVTFLAALGLLWAMAAMGANDAPTPPLVLTGLQQRLMAIVQQYLPDAQVSVTLKDGTVQVVYHARPYLVYTGSMTGEYSDTPVQVSGPKKDGLVLSLAWQPGAYRGAMAETNKLLTERGPYWERCYAVYPSVEGGTLFVDLKYGSGIIPGLLADIKTAVQQAGEGKPLTPPAR